MITCENGKRAAASVVCSSEVAGRAVQAVERDRQRCARRGYNVFGSKSEGPVPFERRGNGRRQTAAGTASVVRRRRIVPGVLCAVLVRGGAAADLVMLAVRGRGKALQRQQQRQQQGEKRPTAAAPGTRANSHGAENIT